MAAKSFREDLRKARLEAISKPKPAPTPVFVPKTEPVEAKTVFTTENKVKTKKEVE